ncbi:MAG: HIT family protein [Armatimonadetes bacterium]|nr:MAG: HIT family protein [Armatimonadota bacterium]
MATMFTQIMTGELPGHIVYRDDICVAFLSIAPHAPGHTLVVPIAEVDNWLDLDRKTLSHVMATSHDVAKALEAEFGPPRVGLMIAGFEVPHAHVHLIPMNTVTDLDFANAKPTDDDTLRNVADRIRLRLTTDTWTE